MPTGSAMARATPIENTVSMSVVGIRSSTRAEADWPWWKNDLPKLPVTALPTKRANWTGSGSCRPSVRRRTARSASGASGMMSDTGSPLACRIANVTSETPAITTARRTSRRTRNADILSQRGRDGPSDTSHGLGAGKAGARTRIRPLALKLGAETAPPTPPHGLGAGRAGARSGIRPLALGLGVEEPEPLVAAGGVLDALGDRQRVVLREQVDRRRLLTDQLLDLRVRPLAGRLVERRAAFVDQLVQPLDPGVVLADPAARLRVEERVEQGVGVEDRVVAPRAVGAVGGLALGLQKLVPRRARVPHPRVRADADLGQHLGERLEDRPELDERAVQRDVDAVGITGLGQQLFGLLGIERERLDVLILAIWVATSGMARTTRCLNAGLPRQWPSKASRRMYWSRFHSTNFHGPVATAAVVPNASSPTFSRCFLGTMGKKTSRSSSSGNGLSVTRWIVSASTMRTSLMARMLPYWGDFFFSLPGSVTRSNENFTSSAVIVSPLWNFTPLRSLNSQVVSLSAFHEVASDGSYSSLAFLCSSESNMLMLTRMPTRSKCMWGSRVGAWEIKATVSVSLG